jgi:pimeloyl-ACP methyl ester carboxylesterase
LPPFDEEAFSRDVKSRKSSRWWRGALVIAILYFAMIALTPFTDQLILFPTTHRIDPGAAVRMPIPFDGGELEIWTAASKLAQERGQPQIYVLRFYGNADRADRWVAAEAEMWDNRAIEVWGMNYPGFGGSTGPARLARLGPAALAAFDAVKRTAGDRPIIVFGASLGATTALHVAAHRKIAGLILHNPPALRQIILRQFGWWNLWLLAGPLARKIPADLDSIANGRAVRVPAIFLLAEKDEVVAPRFQRLVVDAYAGEKRVIPLAGAGHNSPVEGACLANFHDALAWLLPRDSN